MIKTLIATLFITTLSFSQTQTEREAFKLSLIVDAKSVYEMDVPKSPYFVDPKVIQVFPGEKLNIETEVRNDTVYSMKVVKEIAFPERTITLDFSQQGDTRESQQMILTVTNPFDKKLNYNALMFTPKGQRWTPTSIIPIRPKLLNYEMWPHPIITLVLDQWRLE